MLHTYKFDDIPSTSKFKIVSSILRVGLRNESCLKHYVFMFGHLSDQNQKCSDKCQFWSENVQPLFQAL